MLSDRDQMVKEGRYKKLDGLHDWERYIKDDNLTDRERFDMVQMKAKQIEEMAKLDERLATMDDPLAIEKSI